MQPPSVAVFLGQSHVVDFIMFLLHQVHIPPSLPETGLARTSCGGSTGEEGTSTTSAMDTGASIWRRARGGRVAGVEDGDLTGVLVHGNRLAFPQQS